MSISGGYYKSVARAHEVGCDCVQLFTKNNNQWRAKTIDDQDVAMFQSRLAETGVGYPISHSSYLINLASPDDELWKKSIDSFVVELLRAEQLGIPHVVLHPGSFTTSSEELGIKRVIQALNEVHSQCSGLKSQCVLETTAGQGTALGWKFEHLADIVLGIQHPDRVGICFDTCHVFAAGYPLSELKEFKSTMRMFDRIVGLDKIVAFHLNDSKKGLGSRVDRHEHIGEGCIGQEAFAHLVRDRRFRKTPMYLETPKGLRAGVDLDSINLQLLRSFAAVDIS